MRFVNRSCHLCAVFTVVVMVLLLTACVPTSAPVKKRYFWPPFSDQPKLEYLQFFQSDADVYRVRVGFLEEAVFGREKPQSLFDNPYGIYATGHGKFYVSEIGRRYVTVVDLNRGSIEKLEDVKGRLLLFGMPTGIDGDEQGNVYVVDSLAKKILVFDSGGRQRGEWQLNEAKRPLGLAVDGVHRRAYVVDVGSHQVFVLDLNDGHVLFSFGGRGVAAGEFNFPLDADVDASGDLYVLDSMNARVQVFSPDGTFLRQFGERGTALGSFQVPKGIAVGSSGQVYVTDSLANRFVVFSLEGNYLLTVGGKFVADSGEVAPGGFYLPGGIDADAEGGLWIIDSLNRMVHHYQYLDDKYLQQHPILPGQAVQPFVQ